MGNKFNVLSPSQGDVVIIKSDEWYVYEGEMWREMTVEEQIEASY